MSDALNALQAQHAILEAHFASVLLVNATLSRGLVSFQANKTRPGYRWFKYKEAFSESLVHYLLDQLNLTEGQVLDPFAGTGTALFVAAQRGLNGTGIELLPVGYEIMQVRQLALNQDTAPLRAILRRWQLEQPWQHQSASVPFPHLRITQGAFPPETEEALGRYLAALQQEEPTAARLLHFAALCILEDISYTRKDGQYLRWDYRSNRRQGSKPFNKGVIQPFDTAITRKLGEIGDDLAGPQEFDLFAYNGHAGKLDIRCSSCLATLPTLPDMSVEAVLTSPPYCNRYDYTRTYALELAMLGTDEDEIRALRQALVSCTVENRDKTSDLHRWFSDTMYEQVIAIFNAQHELQAILEHLEWQKTTKVLNNPGIPRMVRNYFLEMAFVIFECARILKPNAPFVMVNDNVRYGGIVIPVDLILSNIAQAAGFRVEVIWVLPTGKGNSSQQMGEHGREEVRKCVYIWRRQ